MSIDVLKMVDKATERASAPKTSRKPVFLFLADGQKALIRPMVNLRDALVLSVHNKWSDNPDYRVNAICAKEAGKSCEHCANAKEMEDKKLSASSVLFLPVYVYHVINTKNGQKVTYVEKDEHGQSTEKPVMGFRVLELPLFGRSFSILQAFRMYVRDEDGHDIRVCDFSIEQAGSGTGKNFITKEKTPGPVSAKIAAACPTMEKFKDSILAARPPLIISERVDTLIVEGVMNTSVELDDGEIPEF